MTTQPTAADRELAEEIWNRYLKWAPASICPEIAALIASRRADSEAALLAEIERLRKWLALALGAWLGGTNQDIEDHYAVFDILAKLNWVMIYLAHHVRPMTGTPATTLGYFLRLAFLAAARFMRRSTSAFGTCTSLRVSASNSAKPSGFGGFLPIAILSAVVAAVGVERLADFSAAPASAAPGLGCQRVSFDPHKTRVVLCGQNAVGKPLADDATERLDEPHQVVRFPVIKPEALLVNVALQVERGTPNVGATDRPLEQAEVVLHAVDVNAVANVPRQMIDPAVKVAEVQPDVAGARVGVDLAAPSDVAADVPLERASFGIWNHHRLDGAVASPAFKQPMNDGLSGRAAPGNLLLSFGCVHVLSEAADERFVALNFAPHLPKAGRPHCLADAVQHEPRALLRDAQCSPKFVAANAVLVIGDAPHGHKPLIEAKRAVFKNGVGFIAEHLTASLASQQAARGDFADLFTAALRARHVSVRPLNLLHVFVTDLAIGEVANGVDEGFRGVSHGQNIRLELCEGVASVRSEWLPLRRGGGGHTRMRLAGRTCQRIELSSSGHLRIHHSNSSQPQPQTPQRCARFLLFPQPTHARSFSLTRCWRLLVQLQQSSESERARRQDSHRAARLQSLRPESCSGRLAVCRFQIQGHSAFCRPPSSVRRPLRTPYIRLSRSGNSFRSSFLTPRRFALPFDVVTAQASNDHAATGRAPRDAVVSAPFKHVGNRCVMIALTLKPAEQAFGKPIHLDGLRIDECAKSFGSLNRWHPSIADTWYRAVANLNTSDYSTIRVGPIAAFDAAAKDCALGTGRINQAAKFIVGYHLSISSPIGSGTRRGSLARDT